jgi:hypothetical protein
MKVTYLIRAHHAPSLLERLVRRLADDDARAFIHVNRTTEASVYDEMVARLADVESVRWVPRVVCRYGGFSLVEATLAGIEAIVAEGGAPGHTLLLSGQDYPLRSRSEIEARLAAVGDSSYLHHYALPADEWRAEGGGLDRIERIHLERVRYRTRLLRVPLVRRKLPDGYRPYGGSAFWALSAPALEYVHRFVRENPSFVKFFRHTLIADELFFQTMLVNSPLRESLVNDELHYVDWRAGTMQPATLGADDLDRALGSGKLFARKFDPAASEILDRLDEAAS